MITKREQHLLWVLLTLAIVVGPPYLFAQLTQPRAATLAEAEELAALARERARAVREAEERLRQVEAAATVPPTHLLGEMPFADMEQALREVAQASGVSIAEMTLRSAGAVEAVPWLRQYGAEMEVTGSYDQLVSFMRALEGHPLLVEIPELILQLPSDGQGALTTRLDLHFYRQDEAGTGESPEEGETPAS